MLELTINGQGMGQEVRVPKGARLQIAASARLNPDIDALGRLDVIAQARSSKASGRPARATRSSCARS